MKRPTLFEILKTALYVGAVGYGGPAILALMKRVIVHEKRWISDEEFMNALSLSQILPGAIGVTLLGLYRPEAERGMGRHPDALCVCVSGHGGHHRPGLDLFLVQDPFYVLTTCLQMCIRVHPVRQLPG